MPYGIPWLLENCIKFVSVSRTEFWLAVLTLGGVVYFDVLQGMLIGLASFSAPGHLPFQPAAFDIKLGRGAGDTRGLFRLEPAS